MAPPVVETERHVFINNPQRNIARTKEVRSCKNNHIVTSKYSLLSFLPRNLFEQFTRLANAYFLVLLILQLIKQISSLSPVTTAVPLVFVLAVTAVKDGYDDFKRHKSDRQINNRKATVLRDGRWSEITWSNVVVGDIIRVHNDKPVPADFVILSTSQEHGECFIETADLDGETNLKIRRSLPQTKRLQSDSDLANFKGEIKCEPPNNKLHKYQGTLFVGNEQYPLDNDALVLRGCIMRNTAQTTGVVIFTGPDTKLMQNSGRLRFKRTHMDLTLNRMVLTIFIILIAICIICSVLSSVWEHRTGEDFQSYLIRDDVTDSNLIAFLNFFSYIIVLNTLVPISLYISIEMIRLGQSMLIDLDVAMYHKETNTPACARTTTLNEELGQIDYIFSDKTGTLTQNVMNFLKCSIGGAIYGKEADNTKAYDGFIDDTLKAALDRRQDDVSRFFRLLALCHTVQPEVIEGKVVFQAQSPDEKALVEAARDAGFVFESRTSEHVNILEHGKPVQYELLHIIEFNSTRKRMSMIMRSPEGQIMIFCKGADNIMFERLSEASRAADMAGLEEHLHTFAKDGLRTLVLAQRELSPVFYEAWVRKFKAAETSLEDRDEKVAEAATEVECEFELVGASAIEDKLQFNVPDTIANLKAANIKVWVLTGDKQETAINIGAACRLLTNEMDPLLIINGDTLEDVHAQIVKAKEEIDKNTDPDRVFGLVIDGPSLVFPLPPDEREVKKAVERDASGELRLKWTPERLAEQRKVEDVFVEVSRHCQAVVCCRVSPLQKSQVVKLIKQREGAITLAIGDGANDVSMIKAADIGVGISGLEGRQAVLAADFSIAQFRFLERLLLVHGRWSYMRMCAFLNYFFYKNFAFTLVQFWFAFFCAYSAQTIYDSVFIALYNVVFASLPILAVGIFEQDVGDREAIEHPHLYEAGPRNKLFSPKKFHLSLLRGALHSIIIFFVTYLALREAGAMSFDGKDQGDLLSMGAGLSFTLTIIVTLELTLDIKLWTWFNWVTVLFGPVSWFVLFGILYNWADIGIDYVPEFYGVFNRVMGNRTYWASFFLSVIMAILPSLFKRFQHLQVKPTPIDIVREQLYRLNKPWDPERGRVPHSGSMRRSSYAYSAEDNLRKPKPTLRHDDSHPSRIVENDTEVSEVDWRK